MIFTPRVYQHNMIKHMAQHSRCAIWAGMGMGKTSACLLYLTYLATYDQSKILVIAPLRVARDVWPVEITQWHTFKHLICSPIVGSLSARGRALRRKADIYTINYENIPWLIKTVGKRWPWRTVIIDESTKIKSFRLRQGGKRARALAKMAWTKIEKIIELTGTPSPNGLLDLWGQLWFLDKGERLERTYGAYCAKYFRYKHLNSFSLIATDFAPDIIADKVKDICMSLRAEDWFDIKKIMHYKIPVHLTPDQRKVYLEFQATMYMQLHDGEEVTAAFAAALTMKSLQYVNGAMYTGGDNKNWTEVHNLKIEALKSIIAEMPGENIIVAYHFKSDIARLKQNFPQGVLLDHKSETLEKWNAGEISLLFAHPASAGHGINMQHGGRTIVFFGHSWNMEHREQIIERIGPVRQIQSGYNRVVYVYDIYAPNTVDALVLQRHESKKTIQDILLAAAKGDT